MPDISKYGRKLTGALPTPEGASPRLRIAGPAYCANTGAASVNNANTRPRINSPPSAPPTAAGAVTQSLTRSLAACQADVGTEGPCDGSVGSEAATIWAISSNLGGCFVTLPSASRNMLWQKGHAVPTTCAPVATNSSARSRLTRLPFSSPRNIWPPPAPQQNDRS